MTNNGDGKYSFQSSDGQKIGLPISVLTIDIRTYHRESIDERKLAWIELDFDRRANVWRACVAHLLPPATFARLYSGRGYGSRRNPTRRLSVVQKVIDRLLLRLRVLELSSTCSRSVEHPSETRNSAVIFESNTIPNIYLRFFLSKEEAKSPIGRHGKAQWIYKLLTVSSVVKSVQLSDSPVVFSRI